MFPTICTTRFSTFCPQWRSAVAVTRSYVERQVRNCAFHHVVLACTFQRRWPYSWIFIIFRLWAQSTCSYEQLSVLVPLGVQCTTFSLHFVVAVGSTGGFVAMTRSDPIVHDAHVQMDYVPQQNILGRNSSPQINTHEHNSVLWFLQRIYFVNDSALEFAQLRSPFVSSRNLFLEATLGPNPFLRMPPRARWSFLRSGLRSDLWVPEEESFRTKEVAKPERRRDVPECEFQFCRHGISGGTVDVWRRLEEVTGCAMASQMEQGVSWAISQARMVQQEGKFETKENLRRKQSLEQVGANSLSLTKKKEYTEEVCGMWRNLMQTETNSQRKVFRKSVEEEVLENDWVDEGRREV